MFGKRRDVTWSRVVELEGAYNVRDIGGYAVADGQHVRRGLVYRSASLAELTDADIEVIDALGVKLVIDLRSSAERAHRPTRMRGEVWARDYETSGADLIRALREGDATPETAALLMAGTYRVLHEEQADSFAELFRRIAVGDLPLLFHCAVGKDRTGAAAALLLTLLGVAPGDIFEDYLLTRQTVERSQADARAALAKAGTIVPDDVLAPIIGVEETYLAAMFSAIDEKYGSVCRYAAKHLGVDNERLDAIRASLLE